VGLTGVVLAGGDSQRFGSDKLRFPVDGRAMLERVVDVLAEVADHVVVSVRDPRTARHLKGTVHAPVTWLFDRPELGGAGPGAGMLTALDECDASELLFAPGDMPWLSAEALREIPRQAKARKASSAAPIWPDGWTEPLVQWQRLSPWARKLPILPTRGGQGSRPTDLLRGGRSALLLPVARLSPDPRCFRNVNAPRELRGHPPNAPEAAAARPIVRPVAARRAFWAAARAAVRSESALASRSYRREAHAYARRGIAHLEAHALEDALRCARQAGVATASLEERLSQVQRSMRPQVPSARGRAR
jgi:molybdopterin-guanine dinucleotide biosynthesis protein A